MRWTATQSPLLVRRFTGEKRSDFAIYLKRMRRYEPMISEMLRRRSMPRDLLYRAMIRSFDDRRCEDRQRRGEVRLLAPCFQIDFTRSAGNLTVARSSAAAG